MDVWSIIAIPGAITAGGLILVAAANGFGRWFKDRKTDSTARLTEVIEGAAELRSQLQKDNESLRKEARDIRAELAEAQKDCNKLAIDLAAVTRDLKWATDELNRLRVENSNLTTKIIGMVK